MYVSEELLLQTQRFEEGLLKAASWVPSHRSLHFFLSFASLFHSSTDDVLTLHSTNFLKLCVCYSH